MYLIYDAVLFRAELKREGEHMHARIARFNKRQLFARLENARQARCHMRTPVLNNKLTLNGLASRSQYGFASNCS